MPEDLKIDRRTLLKTAVSAGAAAAAPAVLAADANAEIQAGAAALRVAR